MVIVAIKKDLIEQLLVLVLWRDNPHVFIHMHDATVSLKSGQNKVCN